MKAQKYHKRRSVRGFTLIEVLIALAIITMLGTFAGVKVMGAFKDAQKNGAKVQIANYHQALQAYFLDNSMYPHTTQGLDALINKPTVGKPPPNYRQGVYFDKKELVKDPWGNPFQYVCDDYQNPTITSSGPDREAGNEDDIKSE